MTKPVLIRSNLLFLCIGASVVVADWPQFRGPNSSGVAGGAAPPDPFGPGVNELWRIRMGAGHSSPCIEGDTLFLTTSDREGKQGAVVCLNRADGERVVAYFGSLGLVCLDMAGEKIWDIRMPVAQSYSGNAVSPEIVEEPQVRMLARQGIPEVPSPIYHDGYIYFVKNGGILTCVDLKSGEKIYRIRTKGAGTHYASPILAGDRLYTTAGNGRISVISTGPDPKVIATNDLKEPVFATPAIVGGVLYVRTHHSLFAFGKD